MSLQRFVIPFWVPCCDCAGSWLLGKVAYSAVLAVGVFTIHCMCICPFLFASDREVPDYCLSDTQASESLPFF